jgi:hypothetical protein
MTYAEFVAIARYMHFASTDTARQGLITQFLIETEEDLNQECLGDKLERAIALVTAHKITLYDRASSPGMGGGLAIGGLTSVSQAIGSQSASFSQLKGDTEEEYYSLTPYGLEYLQLRRIKQCALMGWVV